jgi:hypothetical protein
MQISHPFGRAQYPARDPLRRSKDGLSYCPRRAFRGAHGRQLQGAGSGLWTTHDRRFARQLLDRQAGRLDELFRRPTEGDQCTGTTKCDDAVGQAVIPSASLCADGGGTAEHLLHSAQPHLELVRWHEHDRSAFFGRVGRYSSVPGHLCGDHSLVGGGWRAAQRCNPSCRRNRGRKGKGGRGDRPARPSGYHLWERCVARTRAKAG